MMGLGGKLLHRPKDFEVAKLFTDSKLLNERDQKRSDNTCEACYWTYKSSASGVGGDSLTFFSNDDESRFNYVKDESGNILHKETRMGNPGPGVRYTGKLHFSRMIL
jgi:mannosyl-oligosaccharide alpha-1,2-mannosidase